MSSSPHINDQTLRDWLADRLAGEEAARVESHLEACQQCAERIETVSPNTDPMRTRFQAIVQDLSDKEVNDLSGSQIMAYQRLDTPRVKMSELYSSGGLGRIWRAHDTLLDRDIALKELRARYARSPQARERFRREAIITAQLNHPGTAPLYDFVDSGDRPHYTMRLVEGRTLTEVIEAYHQDRGEPTGSRFATLLKLLRYLVSICDTIAYAHSRGVVHRDIKGDNILIGDYGEVIVLDWGIAKQLDADDAPGSASALAPDESPLATQHGQRLGTPYFMAPEQAVGRLDAIGPRTDVYGLAALLYVILTGRPPFAYDGVDRVIEAVLNEPPPPPAKDNPDADAQLEAVCLRGLAKSPDDRQPSASEFGGQVEAWLANRMQQQRAAQERDRFFRLSQDLLAISDAEGRIRQVNPASEEVTGWTVEEMTQMTDLELLHADDLDDVRATRAKLLADAEPLRGLQRRVRCKGGGYKWLSWNVTPIPEEDALYIVGRDITEHKRLEQRLAGLLESMPDGVVVTNERGLIELVNGEAERMSGYSRDELYGRHISVLVAERSREDHRRALRELVENRQDWGGLGYRQFHARRRDGSEFLAEVKHSVLQTEYELLFTGAIRDISHRDHTAAE